MSESGTPRVARDLKKEQLSANRQHTSIVYFHGIGTPRRFEAISRMADAFDQFAQLQEIGSVGRLRQLDAHWETSRAKGEEGEIPYISMTRVVHRFLRGKGYREHGRFQAEGSFRIYEGFWSPAVAGGFSAVQVFLWLLSNFVNPFLVLCRPWRTHIRLKLYFTLSSVRSN